MPTSTDSKTPVLIAGGGPAGLILALQLANHGVKCIVAERNPDTTKWPKMDITNCRSMELFNRLGIGKGFREVGVPQNYSFDVLFSTGLSEGGSLVTKWDLPAPDDWRSFIKAQNDGSMPREPYQRCSQAVLEAWLKPQLQSHPLIDARWGTKFDNFTETKDGVSSKLVDVENGNEQWVESQYLVGCDGAGSRVRRALDIKLEGGPLPAAMGLVHFRSRDLGVLHKQGQFWHIFFSKGGAIISQDEVDTWTVHKKISLDEYEDWSKVDALDAISDVIGASSGTCPIQIDEVLLKSSWRPSLAVAECYTSPGHRVFLSGDAAHQNIPTGGYGMNTAVGDSFDLGWKLAACVNGYGGKGLLSSYEKERKPVARRNIDRSGVHFGIHAGYWGWVQEAGAAAILSKNEEGRSLRAKWIDRVTEHDGENKDHGIELGYRYNGSPVVVPDTGSTEPPWSERHYIASTWPGARAPHVYLADGKTSIYDLFGPDFSIVDFSEDGRYAEAFVDAAKAINVPLKPICLPMEKHARNVWERDAVLIRPDDHVAWRAPVNDWSSPSALQILQIATGW